MNRALRVAWPALTIVLALATSIAATAAVSGGSSPLLVARAAVLVLLGLAVAAVLGAVVVAALTAEDAARGRLLDVGAAAAAAWTVLAAVTAFLLYLGQAPAIDSPSFGPGLVAFVFELDIGRAWLIATAMAAVLTALLIGIRSRRGVTSLALVTVIAAVPIALQSAMSGDPLDVERGVVTAGLVQLVGLGAWVGTVVLGSARLVPVIAFCAVGVGVAASAPALAADGAITPIALSGAALVVVAGIVAVVAAVGRRELRAPQLVLLAVGLGLAVAGAVTRTAPDVPARTTPAEILTGSPLPQAPGFGVLAASWRPDAVWLVVATALLVVYLVAVRRAVTPWTAAPTASWVVGVLLLVWLTNGGPAAYAPVLIAAHLAQHAALLLVVPVLLAGGAPLRLLAAQPRPLTGPAPTGPAPTGAGPVPALVLSLVVLLALYGTGLLRWSVTDAIGTEVAVAVCLLVGGLLVRALGAPGARRRSAVVAAIVLLAAEAGGAALLASGGGLLAADWYGAMGWGTDALAAQRAAAVLTWPIAVVPTVVLLIAALRSPARPLARPEAVLA